MFVVFQNSTMLTTLPFATLVFILCETVNSDFRCPDLEKSTLCACKEVVWWDNENKTIVDCKSASLHKIPNLRFLSTKEITKLLLSGNNISRITSEDFKNVYIHELDLSRNSLTQLERESILHLSSVLTHLNLKSNHIQLNKGLKFIDRFVSLEELILDSNFISEDFNDSSILPNDLFEPLGLVSLMTLSLRSCGINAIESMAFRGLQSLETLDLTYNDLEEIPSAIRKLSNLKKLVLAANSITIIRNDTFVDMILEEIVLDYNDIGIIEPGAFNGLQNSLKMLELHSNFLSPIPSASFANLRSLSFLKISKNDIRKIERNAFEGMRSLKMLELDGNDIEFTNDSFISLSDTLDTLLIRGTGLTHLPINELLTLKTLETLDVSFNEIGPILDADIGRLNLKTLVMTNNKIVSITNRTFKNVKRPLELDLDNNEISDISFILNVSPCSFSYVDVIGNSLPCNCDLELALNSGMMQGIGLTGQCKNIHGRNYELGSSSLTRTLDKLCNRTERIYWCQNLFGPINVSVIIKQSFVLTVIAIILFVLILWSNLTIAHVYFYLYFLI